MSPLPSCDNPGMLTVLMRAVTDEPHVCVFYSRPTARADPAGGAKSLLPEQRRLFPTHHATLLLRLDRRVRQRH